MSDEDRAKNVIGLIEEHFAEDIADSLTSGEGEFDLAEAIINAADYEDIDDDEAVVRLLGELTAFDRQYILGDLGAGPVDAGSYIAAKIEANHYI